MRTRLPNSTRAWATVSQIRGCRTARNELGNEAGRPHLLTMIDTLSPARRSWLMSRIRGKHTSPEMTLRRALHGLGYRYRLHRKGLPGSPDLVFPSRKKAIWVHGCFWHWHPDPACPIAKTPKSRTAYWSAKFTRNRARDARNLQAIVAVGWTALNVWECELHPRKLGATLRRVEEFLADYGSSATGGNGGTSSG